MAINKKTYEQLSKRLTAYETEMKKAFEAGQKGWKAPSKAKLLDGIATKNYFSESIEKNIKNCELAKDIHDRYEALKAASYSYQKSKEEIAKQKNEVSELRDFIQKLFQDNNTLLERNIQLTRDIQFAESQFNIEITRNVREPTTHYEYGADVIPFNPKKLN